MADDSGIEVKALKGAPGIYSSRFAGQGANDEVRNKKLLKMLEGLPMNKRQARYVCVIALVNAKGEELGVVQGTCSGYVTTHPVGQNGFGYDPLFLVKRYNQTFGQLHSSVKAKISHRARALRKFRQLLASI
ncbi:MAG: non-canonical purine NTP pyrophosphatase, partial [Candidatus Omnitrophica bacterium]|nr:non-canonical purine NTP pyrophosphatase [Candidatus Omnitrophota bacterium]